MERYIGYKIKLFPTEEQTKRLISICNTFRFCYNWALNYANTEYEEGRKNPHYFDYNIEFNKFRNQPENSWLLDYPLATCRYAFRNVETAFENFFSKRCRHPKFKSKRTDKFKFHVREDRLYFYGDHNEYVAIEGMGRQNYIYCKNHNIPVYSNCKYYNAYVSYDKDSFWLSLNVKFEFPIIPIADNEPLGVDIGIRKMIALSNGKIYPTPDISKFDKRKRRLDKRMIAGVQRMFEESKCTKTKYKDIPKTKNQIKREAAYRKCIRKMDNIFNTYIHQVTHEIAEMKPEYIVLEDLRITDIYKSEPYMSRTIYNMRAYDIRTKLSYKCKANGSNVIIAPQSFPSSQICSCCGSKRKIGSEKVYRCKVCGAVIDRDINAAINLREYGRSIMAQV
jgi:putative transposase